MSEVSLHQSANGWQFVSEAALEKFVWEKLKQLFHVVPLKQQYISNGEICDILAVDSDGTLVILELKNVEDRYLIQQLTRYYANLLEEQPFSDKVNYSLPVRLIALSPSYHRHNLIDRQYSRLTFELFQFSVVEDERTYHFLLRKLEEEFPCQQVSIPYQPLEISTTEKIPEPPELLIKWLSGCSKEEQEGFLLVRRNILTCSQRMKETLDKRIIHYGSGKTRLCAEICFQQKSQKPILFLWLPTPSSYLLRSSRKLMIGRLRVWTNGETITHVGYVPEGFGKMKTMSEWEQIPPEKRPRMRHNASSKSHTPIEVEGYLRCRSSSEKLDFWEVLSSLATEKWLEKG